MALNVDPVRPKARPMGFSCWSRRHTVSNTCHRVSAASPNAVTHSRASPHTVAASSSSAV